MSETSKRAELAGHLRRLLNTSAICVQPDPESVAKFVCGIVDAAKDELRAELDAGIAARAPQGSAEARPAPAPLTEPADRNWRVERKPCKACGTPVKEIAEFKPYVGWVTRKYAPEAAPVARVTCQCRAVMCG